MTGGTCKRAQMALQTVFEDSKMEQREARQCKYDFKKAGGEFDFPL